VFIAVLILTLGIGANTAIFSLFNATSLRASAIHEPDRVAFIWTTPAAHPESREGVRLAEYYFWKAQGRAFDQFGIMLGWSSTIGPIQDGLAAERLSGWRFSASMFKALGVQPELGRLFTEEEDRTDGPSNVVVISHHLWQTHFGGDPSVLNRTLVMDGTTTSIIGVLPPTFNFFGSNFDFWLPQNFTRFQMQARSPSRVPMAIGHVKPGVSLRQAQSEMDALAAQLAQSDPDLQKGRGVRLQRLDDMMFGWLRRLMLVLQGAVGFVLLIACANVAGLFLVRAASQQREVAIRCSLGASRFRILRQFLTESFILSIGGGILGVILASSALRSLVAAGPQWLSAVTHLDIDARVLAVSTGMVILTAVVCGVVPALQVPNTDLEPLAVAHVAAFKMGWWWYR